MLINRKVLNFNDVQAAITRIRKGINKGKPSLEPIEKHFKQIKKERQRLIDLFRSGLIERDEVERELTILNEQKRAVIANMVAAKSSSGMVDISDDEIKRIIENLAEEIRKADSKRKKRIVQTLFEEIKIFPKKGDPWERTLEIRGVYLPLTGVFVASPRGFEPLLPT